MKRFAVNVLGNMVSFDDAESLEIARDEMRQAGISRAPIYSLYKAPDEWIALDGATLLTDDK